MENGKRVYLIGAQWQIKFTATIPSGLGLFSVVYTGAIYVGAIPAFAMERDIGSNSVSQTREIKSIRFHVMALLVRNYHGYPNDQKWALSLSGNAPIR
jgi:hypothetical protein